MFDISLDKWNAKFQKKMVHNWKMNSVKKSSDGKLSHSLHEKAYCYDLRPVRKRKVQVIDHEGPLSLILKTNVIV